MEGKISTRSWKTKTNEIKYTTEIVANELIFLNYEASSISDSAATMATQSQINEVIASIGVDL